MPLQRRRRYSGIGKVLGRPRGRSQAEDFMSISLSDVVNRCERRGLAATSDTLQRHDAILIGEDRVDGDALTIVKTMTVEHGLDVAARLSQGRVLALSAAHLNNRVALEVNHFWRRKHTSGRAETRLDLDEGGSVDATVNFGLDLGDGPLTHRTHQCIARDRSFVDDCRPFEIAIRSKGDGGASRDSRTSFVETPVGFLGQADHLSGLIAEGLGECSVLLLYLFG
jgi:hypothetical protein